MDLNLKHSMKHNHNNVPPENPFNDEVEKQHFYSILAAFKYYKYVPVKYYIFPFVCKVQCV